MCGQFTYLCVICICIVCARPCAGELTAQGISVHFYLYLRVFCICICICVCVYYACKTLYRSVGSSADRPLSLCLSGVPAHPPCICLCICFCFSYFQTLVSLPLWCPSPPKLYFFVFIFALSYLFKDL